MGRITTGIGLITGFPIEDTVAKLIAVSARPRDLLKTRVDTLTTQQNVLTAISAALLKLNLTSAKLGSPSVFDQRSGTSSDQSLIRVTTSGSPAVGSYQFTPLQKAQSQQLLSSGFAASDAPIGAGKLTLRFGGAVNEGVGLALLQGGRGVEPGSIRITDRSGASAVIDLRGARNVDDVLELVNNNPNVNVRLETQGNRFVLVDTSGQTASNLKVQEVAGGNTAADLGLAGIDVAASQAQGQAVVYLGRDVLLANLNDGNGIRFDPKLPDLLVNFHDGSTPLEIDFTQPGIAGTQPTATTSAAAGLNGQLIFTALKAGSAYAGVQIRFQHDPGVAKGSETASYDANAKVLTFKISEGTTTASDVIGALARNPSVAALFTVRLAEGSNGMGLVFSTDSGVLTGPPASAITPGVLGANSRIQFTAVHEGPNYDGVHIWFVDDPQITAGAETATYDASNPADKKLIIRIRAGATTANDVINAVNNDPLVGALFRANRAAGSDGSGLVDPGDDVVTSGGTIVEPVAAKSATTVGDLLDAINAADPARLRAQISSDGQSLELVDLTAGAGSFRIADLNGSHAAADLGLVADTTDPTITGRKVLSGLKTVLLSSLNGGKGLQPLGLLELTDRAGASATVNLAAAQTLDDVIQAINDAGLGIRAQVNSARNGIALIDLTGQTTSNLIVASGDAAQSAEKLGINVDAATATVNSGSLNRQTVNENTLLSSLNGGAGIALGSFRVLNTASGYGTIDLASGTIKTVGDLIAAIDNLHLGVEAQINDAGDGILLVDTIGGAGKLRVEDVNGSAARDLRLTGESTIKQINGQNRQVLDGATSYVIDVSAVDTLDDLVTKINGLNAGFTAALFNSGAGATPFKLTINSQRSGRVGNLLFDTSAANFTLQETVQGRDALVLFGSAGGGTISSSNTNEFKNILPGVNLQIVGTSSTPVTVSVVSSASGAVDAIKALVDAYNQVRSMIADATKFQPPADGETEGKSGPLVGDTSLLTVQNGLASLFSDRFFNAGSIQALAAVGINVERDGTLSFDAQKFNNKLASDPQAVKDFFTTSQFGFVDRLKKTVDRLSSGDYAVLINRLDALNGTIADANAKIADWDKRLDAQRNLLLTRFYYMETAIGKMQNQLNVIEQIRSFQLALNSNTTTRR